MIHPCPVCSKIMVRSTVYDPDDMKALYSGEKEYKDGKYVEWWVCTNPGCLDGNKNTSVDRRQ